MKHFTHFWLALIGLLVAQPLSAQLYEVQLNDRIDRSAYIFEGKVLESNSFYGPGGRMIYTSHLVQVYSVFKGECPGDQVEIVTAGGSVDGQSVEITHNLELFKGQHGIFFANPTTRPSDRQANSGLSLRVYAGLQGFVRFHFDGINPRASGQFHVYRQPETELFPLIEARTGQSRRNWSATASRSIPFEPTIKYYFSYPQLAQVGTQTYLNFEVQAQVDGGSYEFGDARIYIEYDTSFIGSNLVGTGKISITSGDLTSSTDYSLSMTDYGSNVLEIDIDAADPPLNLDEINVFLEDVVNVQVDVTGITPGIDALFEESLMEGESFYYDQVSGTYVEFPFVWAVDSVAFTSSTDSVVVDSLYPSFLTAGTFDTLYIEGSGFGDIPGKFLFTDANAGFLIQTPAPSEDVIWTDSLLKIHVFSTNDTGGVAGSGFISLLTDQGDTLQDFDAVFIRYAIDNRRDQNNLSYLTILSDLSGGDGNFTFELSPEISLNSDTAEIVRTALLQWQCATGISWSLADASADDDTLLADGFNRIFFADSLQYGFDDGVFAIRRSFSQDCSSGGEPYRYVFEVDIVINKDINWEFTTDLTSSPDTSKYDFWTVILHELGHAHLLKHALETTSPKVMHPSIGKGDTLRRLQIDDISGGLWIIDSIASARPNCPPIVNQDFGIDCSGINSVREVSLPPSLLIKVFPNPLSDQSDFTIEVESQISGNCQISLSNSMGQTIWEEQIFLSRGQRYLTMPSPYSNGVYFLRLEISGQAVSKVLIK